MSNKEIYVRTRFGKFVEGYEEYGQLRINVQGDKLFGGAGEGDEGCGEVDNVGEIAREECQVGGYDAVDDDEVMVHYFCIGGTLTERSSSVTLLQTDKTMP